MITPDMMYDPFTQNRNNFIRYRLIPALRSEHYKQARNYLRTEEGYCCLGVACDLYGVTWDDEVGVGGNRSATFIGASYKNTSWSGSALPTELARDLDVTILISVKMEVADFVPHLELPRLTRDETPASVISMSGLNDAGLTFAQIADVLEAALDNDLLVPYENGYEYDDYARTESLSLARGS